MVETRCSNCGNDRKECDTLQRCSACNKLLRGIFYCDGDWHYCSEKCYLEEKLEEAEWEKDE